MSAAIRSIRPLNPDWVDNVQDEVECLRREMMAIEGVAGLLGDGQPATVVRHLIQNAFAHMINIESAIPPPAGR